MQGFFKALTRGRSLIGKAASEPSSFPADMTWLGVVGNGLVAFGPVSAIAFFLVGQRSHLSILAVVAAFFWLIAAMFCAILWVAVPPLKGEFSWIIPSGVVIHEIFRWVFYYLYQRSEGAIKRALSGGVSKHEMPLRDLSSALSAGVGYGLMESIILYGSVLEHGFGKGTLYNQACHSVSVFTAGAYSTCLISLMQVAWMILAFNGYRNRSPVRIISLFVLHMGSSMITIMNRTNNLCVAGLGIQVGCFVLSAGAAYVSHTYANAKEGFVLAASDGDGPGNYVSAGTSRAISNQGEEKS